MYILTSRVGDNCAILDTNDGALDWLDLKQVKSLVTKGIQIIGIDLNGLSPRAYKIESTMLNWNNGQNIFQTGRRWTMSSKGVFKFIAGSKTYKGMVVDRHGDVYVLQFNSGVVTEVNISVILTMQNR